jgi:DNA (cytosine-5)-methyltransferase 1
MEHLPARTGEARERQLHRGGSNSRRSSSGNLREDILQLTTLPTPTVFHVSMHDEPIDTFLAREEKSSTGQIGKSLGVALRMEMFPTPVASEGYKAPAQQDAETKGKTGQVWLSNEAKGLSNSNAGWGKFEPAIRRWEQTIGLDAPTPTKPDGKEDQHRLSSEFTEWMMGLEPGWITRCGLTRNEELKACGNGVVPQQAELALTILLDGVALD